MKTILVIYTNTPIKKENVGYTKRYAFNTSSEVKEGDMLKSPNYDTKMQVVKVLDTSFKYFNRTTGELSDTFLNSNQYEIREMKLTDNLQDVILASKVE